MTNFLGYVLFTQADKQYTAHLKEDGWQLPEFLALARYLNLVASLSKFGPADGDPVHGAVEAARKVLDGTETYARPSPEYPEGTIF